VGGLFSISRSYSSKDLGFLHHDVLGYLVPHFVLAGRLFRDDGLGGLDDRRGTSRNSFCDPPLEYLELLLNLDDDLLAEPPDASELKRLDGIELGEELRERMLVRVDGRVGRVERKARRFRTLDRSKWASGEGEGALEGLECPRNLGNGGNGSSALNCVGPVGFSRLRGRSRSGCSGS
jgi:hypothetical protein